MATMEEVARLANVSMSTVSHVLNRTRKVSPETIRAVEDAMKSIGYVPNALARALAGSVSSTIGVAVSGLTNHYFAETVRAIESECARNGLMVLFADTHDDPEQELKVIQALHQRRVDGILLAPTTDLTNRTLNFLQANKIPSVLVDRAVVADFDQVSVENEKSTAELILHLVGHGHQRIGFIAGAPGLSTTDERISGYRHALALSKIPFDSSLLRCGESRMESSCRATNELLALPVRPTAIMAANNLMTIGAMHALRDAHLDVPKDIALVGFDDFDWAEYFTPRLTVIAQPLEELGAKAVRLLMKRIENPEGSLEVVRLTPKLHIRNSCGCE